MSHVSIAQRAANLSKLLAVFVVLALLAAVLVGFSRGGSTKSVLVDFPQTNAVYKGSEVRILGVRVGTVEKLTPRGDVVRAEISYDSQIKLPEDVKAVIISPAIVGDRFVQFSPVYTAGRALADGATVGVDRTAVPVELDEINQSLSDLSVALGPKGANQDGSLSSLVSDSANQLDGQGAKLNETIRNFGKLSTTLANNSDDLFAGVTEVSEFVATLKRNDQVVRSFNENTAGVAEVLAGEREDLAATLATLSEALIDVEGLVRDNRESLRTNVSNLRVVAETLSARSAEFDEITVAGPTALTNVALAYNGVYGTLDTRANLEATLAKLISDPLSLICGLFGESTTGTDGLCSTIAGLLEKLGLGLLQPRTAVASGPLKSDQAPQTVAEMLAVNP